MDLPWVLFIYTVPSQPSRKRAYVWRELKRLGAVYLRDGVAVLPARSDLRQRLEALAERVIEYEGTADVVPVPQFPEGRLEELVGRFKEEREAEYREVYHGCVRFLRDVLHEVSADDFGFPDVDNLESELVRLRRWYGQIEERDYFHAPGADRVAGILEKCDTSFDRFVATASERESEPLRHPEDDVFERLGGAAAVESAEERPL